MLEVTKVYPSVLSHHPSNFNIVSTILVSIRFITKGFLDKTIGKFQELELNQQIRLISLMTEEYDVFIINKSVYQLVKEKIFVRIDKVICKKKVFLFTKLSYLNILNK